MLFSKIIYRPVTIENQRGRKASPHKVRELYCGVEGKNKPREITPYFQLLKQQVYQKINPNSSTVNWRTSVTILSLGTICARDPSTARVFESANSGSGLFMERFQGGYSWEGTLSAYRGHSFETVGLSNIFVRIQN